MVRSVRSMVGRAGGSDGNCRLSIECLEEIVVLSVSPMDADYAAWRGTNLSTNSEYEAWRNATFTVDTTYAQDAPLALDVEANNTRARSHIGADSVAASYGLTGSGYAVVVIDTGVDYTHPALQSSWIGGYDFVDNDHDPMDGNGHGTHVAGTIASSSSSHPGIAPDVGIIGLRVLGNNGSGSYGDVEDALRWVINNLENYNIAAINMSLGAGNFSFNPYTFLEDEFETLAQNGVFISVSSGNSFYSNNSAPGVGYPSISSNVVSVGAVWTADFGSVNWGSGARDYTTAKDRITSFTQRGSMLDIMAPGAFITSTYLHGGFSSMAGTSMAAPVVAASAALIHQGLDLAGKGHLANQATILSIMQGTGITIVDGDDENDNVINTGLSFKRLDLGAAIASLGIGGGGGGGGGGGEYNPPHQDLNATDPAVSFVRSLYQEVLQRTPDQAGLNHWAHQVNSGAPRTAVAQLFWNSAEHRAIQVEGYFQTYLGRVPGESEVTNWVAAMQSGVDELAAVRIFLGSPEYNQRYASNASFVSGLYQDVLGRGADSAGLNHWATVLNSGASREALVSTFVLSGENLARHVQLSYQQHLGRPAEASAVQFWVNGLRNGSMTVSGMESLILGSDEYFQKVAAKNSAIGIRAEGFAYLGDAGGTAAWGSVFTVTTASDPLVAQPDALADRVFAAEARQILNDGNPPLVAAATPETLANALGLAYAELDKDEVPTPAASQAQLLAALDTLHSL